MLFYYSYSQVKSNSLEIEVIYKHDYWEIYDYSNGKYPTKQSLENEIYECLEEIPKLIGEENWMRQYIEEGFEKIYISVAINDRSQIGGKMSYPTDHVDNSIMFTMLLDSKIFSGEREIDILGHELTHLITYQKEEQCFSFSQFMNEGLCNYVHEEITKKNVFGVDVHEYTMFLMQKSEDEGVSDDVRASLQDVLDNIGQYAPKYIYKQSEDEFGLSYLYSSSYAKFIIDEFGVDKYMELHRPLASSDDIEEREQINDAYKAQWLKYLAKNYPTMSKDQIDDALNSRSSN